jgi:hypothetical protein
MNKGHPAWNPGNRSMPEIDFGFVTMSILACNAIVAIDEEKIDVAYR